MTEKDKGCPEYDTCIERRVADAEMRGEFRVKLVEIDKKVDAVFRLIGEQRQDIKQLYFRMGMLSGAISLIVSLVMSLMISWMKR